MENTLRTVVFDLDGTLVDTIEDIRGALNTALAAFGQPGLETQQVKDMVGGGVEDMLREAIGEQAIPFEVFRDRYRGYYRDNIDRFTTPYMGIPELIRALHAKGVSLAVLTNKQTGPARRILDLFGLSAYFTVVAGPDHYGVHKPDPAGLLQLMRDIGASPDTTVFVGDSEPDIQVAAGAGVRCVAVGYGYRPLSVLQMLSPWREAVDVAALHRVLMA